VKKKALVLKGEKNLKAEVTDLKVLLLKNIAKKELKSRLFRFRFFKFSFFFQA